MSTATTGTPASFRLAIAAAHSSSGMPAEAGPEDRVHGDVRSRELPPETVLVERPHADAGDLVQASSVRGRRLPQLVGILEQHHGGPHPPATELPSGHQAVAAVVALPADHDRSAAVRAARELARRPRHGTAGPLHQHVGRDTPSLRLPVERRGLVRGQDGFHRTAIANATAFDLSWLKVISTALMPSASARRFAFPSRRIAGAPDGSRVTLMSSHRRPR